MRVPVLKGDGGVCAEIDGCAPAPCLAGTSCTDVLAPGVGFHCTVCAGPACPILRALAGPDLEIVTGAATTLMGTAVGYNGAYTCAWTSDQDAGVQSGCTLVVAPTVETVFTLTVTDASERSATDTVVVRVTALVANAGADSNIGATEMATVRASWSGASCSNEDCILCEWRRSDGTLEASTCAAQVTPAATTQYFLAVTDKGTGRTAADSATVFVTNRSAQLCGWNVVVLTSDEYPTDPNPSYLCDASGTARRQVINGKPAIVLSDLVVENVRITGHISVESSADDDLIGFLWGWQSPKQAYLLSWKQLAQTWTAKCGDTPEGIAIKKIDGARAAPSTITFNPTFGFNATNYVYSCATLWSQNRTNAALPNDATLFLMAPGDLAVHENSASSEDLAATSANVSHQAVALQSAMAFFKVARAEEAVEAITPKQRRRQGALSQQSGPAPLYR